jgi:hypothetical protein
MLLDWVLALLQEYAQEIDSWVVKLRAKTVLTSCCCVQRNCYAFGVSIARLVCYLSIIIAGLRRSDFGKDLMT